MKQRRTARQKLITGALVACAAITSLAGCTTASDRLWEPDRILTLEPGEHIALPDGASLRYVGVRTDSRCPPAVQCVWAGEAEVAFEFTPASLTPTGPAARPASPATRSPVEIVLRVPEQPTAPIGDWQLQLVSLDFGTAPRASVRIHRHGAP